jgi:hypothetical protein
MLYFEVLLLQSIPHTNIHNKPSLFACRLTDFNATNLFNQTTAFHTSRLFDTSSLGRQMFAVFSTLVTVRCFTYVLPPSHFR